MESRVRARTALMMEPKGQALTIKGWVRTKRSAKNVIFLEINDGSCLSNIQAIVDGERSDLAATAESVTTGASVSVTGSLVESMGKNQKVELAVEKLELIGPAPSEEYPLQKKRHSFEFLREIAHLRPRTNTFGAVARVRNYLSYAIHRFFQDHGFIYVHTPIITASDAEGAGELFRVTTLEARAPADYSEDFFGRQAFLTVSGQLNAEIYASALDRVYTFGPTFRAENSHTTRHLSEFWMVEPEIASATSSATWTSQKSSSDRSYQDCLRSATRTWPSSTCGSRRASSRASEASQRAPSSGSPIRRR